MTISITSLIRPSMMKNVKKLCLLTCVCGVFSFLWIPNPVIRENCSYTRTVSVVQEVCDLYHDKKIYGNMCASLCDHNHFTLRYCGNDIFSEKSVLIADCNGCDLDKTVERVVIKVGVNRTVWENTTAEILTMSDSTKETVQRLRFLLKSKFIEYIGIKKIVENDHLRTILGKDFRSYLGTKNTDLTSRKELHAMVRTVVALALQNEYIKILALKEYDIAPEVYGFCGPAYFLEHAMPVAESGYLLFSSIYNNRFRLKPWEDRAKAALGLVQTLRKLDNNHTTLEICDIAERNAGIDTKNNIVFFDLDYTGYRVGNFEGLPCEFDDQCYQGTCHGYCNTTSGKCLGKRRENNLQVICERLFYSWKGINGMLRFPPWSVRKELSDVLRHCVHPSNFYNTPESNKAGPDISDKLEAVLKRSLED